MLSAGKRKSAYWRKFSGLCVCFLKENMSAFCVETQDRALVFAALKDDCLAWVEKLCHSTFQVGPLVSPIHTNHMTHRVSRRHTLNSLSLSARISAGF